MFDSKAAFTLTAAFVVSASVAFAQAIERPSLPRKADANDWESYYDAGIARLWRDPGGADAYFEYASRLRPDRAEPLYARFIAFHARDLDRFTLYVRDDAKTLRLPAVMSADTLRQRAFRRNPFVHQGLLMFLFDRLPGRFRDDPITRAWIHLGNGELPQSLSLLGASIRREPERFGYLRFVRASAFVNSGRPDSALLELDSLLTQLRRADTATRVGRYETKELLEYARGLLLMRRRSAAKDAFGSSVVENAAFAPARMMLAQIALTERDTATALAELDLAIATDSTDVELHVTRGRALRQANRLPEAKAALEKAIQLEPLYALPRYHHAGVLEASGDKAGAAAAYKRFTEMAAMNDPLLPEAEKKLATLK
jgi:tetratricopeptide (TPR) repeat protein